MVPLCSEPEDIPFPIPVTVATPTPAQLFCERKLKLHHVLLLEILKKEKAYAFWFATSYNSARTI